MTRALTLTLTLLLASPVLAQQATRADLARSYQRFEQTLRKARLDAAERTKVERAFDQATIAFFQGANVRAIRQLDELSERLSGAQPAVAGCVLRATPARWARGAAPPRLELGRLYETKRELGALRLDFVRGGRVAASQPLDPSAPVFAAAALELEPGTYQLLLASGKEAPLEVGRFGVVARPLHETRAGLEARLAKAARADAVARACCARRLKLLAQPNPKDLASVLVDIAELEVELEEEVRALERGRNPYARRAGNQWRALDALPYRVFAPEGALEAREPLPLVVAFHGVGGDENMFLYGYGAGELARQATRCGFLAVTPRTERVISNPKAFLALLEQVSRDYPVDRARVFVIGHSMGTGAVTRLIASYPERIAAAVCFAGAGGPGQVPTLALRGSLDPFAGFVGRARPTAGVESEVLEGRGHTLLVGERLGQAFDWLLEKAPAKTPPWF